MNGLSAADYLVIAAYLLGILLIGACFSRRQTSLREYFLASRNIPWWAAGISVFATLLSTNSFLGGPGWVFARDSRFLITGGIVGTGTTILGAMVWVRLWGRLQVLSIYEYLERRYHPGLRVFGALLFLCYCLFWIGNALLTAAMGFNAATGLPVTFCLVGIVLLTMVYTTLGGARAVVWTDVIQFSVFILSYGVIAFLLLDEFLWNPSDIYLIASSKESGITGYPHTAMVSFEFSLAVEATFWAILFSRFQTAMQFGADQIHVQRVLTTRSQPDMFRAFASYAVLGLIFSVIYTLIGWALVAFYDRHPDLTDSLDHPDQVLVHFVVARAPALVRGLIMAGVLAAIMSTLSSVINSMSSITTVDFYARFWRKGRSEQQLAATSKTFTVVHALLLLSFALWQYQHSDANVFERELKLIALTAAPVVTFFVLGIFSRRANTGGVLIGGAAGMATALILNGFQGVMDPLVTGINFFWVPGLSTAVSLMAGSMASRLFPAPDPNVLKHLMVR